MFACSEHFLDGKPTEINPIPQLKLGYEKKTTPARRKLARHEPESKKRKYRKKAVRGYIPVILFLHLQDIKRNTFQKLSVSLMFLNRQVLAQENTIQIFRLFGKRWSHIRETMDWQPDYVYTDNNTFNGRKGCSSYDWNRYYVGKRQCSDRLRLFVVYRGNERDIFALVKLMKIENTFSFQLDVTDQLLLVLMKLILSLLFNDLARWFGISKGLASRMYNSWMPVLAE